MQKRKKIISVFLFVFLSALPILAQEDSSDERLAAQYFRNGEFERAVSLYEELFEEKPTEVIYNNYLKCLLELEEYGQAENVVKSQIEDETGKVRYKVDLGYVMKEAGNTRRANRHFNRLIDDMPGRHQDITDLAEAFLKRDMTEHALETYEEGRKILGSAYHFNIQIAEIYEKTGEYEKMMEEYVDLIAKDSGEMEKVRGILQDALDDDPEFEKNDALRRVLLKSTQKDPDRTLYSEMLLWLSFQQKDFEMALRQAKTLDRRLQRGEEFVHEVAELSLTNNDFDVSEEAYNYIIEKGPSGSYFLEARVGLLEVKFERLTASYDYELHELKDVEKAYHDALDEFGVHANTVPLIRNLANIKAFYLDKPGEAVNLLESIIEMPRVSNRVKAECRIEMADILVLNGEVWDAKLLYSRVDKSYSDHPVGHEAKFKNARLSFYMGEFEWAKAQLDILKAATSKLIANDAMALSLKIQDNIGFDEDTQPLEMYSMAEKKAFMNKFDEAFKILDSIKIKFPEHQINDNVLFTKAELNMQTGSYHEADSLLELVVEQYPQSILADEALFKRAELNENVLERTDKAGEIYQEIMVDFPASIYNRTARTRYRNLRGDLIN